MGQGADRGDSLVSAIVYLEGGGDSKELRARCREGFRKLLEACGFGDTHRMPRLVACGGRDSTFADFLIAHEHNPDSRYVAMWIDSEQAMADINSPWTHLENVTTVSRWPKPARATADQVLIMATCMETWIVADLATLRTHYGSKLRESSLPSLVNLEERSRHDVQDRLYPATEACSNAYSKGTRSFEILGRLNPTVLQNHLPSFVRVRQILNIKL